MSSPNFGHTHTILYNSAQTLPSHVEIIDPTVGYSLPVDTHTHIPVMEDSLHTKNLHTTPPKSPHYKAHENSLINFYGAPFDDIEPPKVAPITHKTHTSKSHSKWADLHTPQNKQTEYIYTHNKQKTELKDMDTHSTHTPFEPLISTDHFIPQNKLLQQTMLLSFWANICILGTKIYISFSSQSMVIIACTIDSLMDVLSGILILITQRIILQKQLVNFDNDYPAGRGLLEPVCTIVYATIMASVSVQLCFICIQQLFFPKEIPPTIDVSILFVLFFTVLIKLILWAFCIILSKSRGDYIFVITNDHKSDVITNAIGFVLSIVLFFDNTLRLVDNIGALLIAGFASFTWIYSNRDQIRVLSGYKADHSFYTHIATIVANFPEVKLDDIKAYHFGVKYMVEVAIVMDPASTVRDYVQIEKRLQRSIKNLSKVQQCFISIDYESRFNTTSFSENIENKIHRRRPIEINNE